MPPAPQLPPHRLRGSRQLSRCLVFDLRLHRPAKTTGATTAVGAEVAGTSAALDGSIIADFAPLSLRSQQRAVAAESLLGGVELQGGDTGSCGGAAARQPPPGGSGEPPTPLRRLWRRCVGR